RQGRDLERGLDADAAHRVAHRHLFQRAPCADAGQGQGGNQENPGRLPPCRYHRPPPRPLHAFLPRLPANRQLPDSSQPAPALPCRSPRDPRAAAAWAGGRNRRQYAALSASPFRSATMPSRRDLANAIRALAMDAVEAARSGHPGMPMGMADIAEVLWTDFLRHDPGNPAWPDRDRFVVSNGHGSMLLYALLHLSGYDLPIEELKRFRQLHSRTPGHPEAFHTPGVETTTGPLGQGFANAVRSEEHTSELQS